MKNTRAHPGKAGSADVKKEVRIMADVMVRMQCVAMRCRMLASRVENMAGTYGPVSARPNKLRC